jgi:hypothetical protein
MTGHLARVRVFCAVRAVASSSPLLSWAFRMLVVAARLNRSALVQAEMQQQVR